jgi:hypothetical protein
VPQARQNRSAANGNSVVPTGLGSITYAHPALSAGLDSFAPTALERDDPNSVIARENLAVLLREMGRDEEADKL